MSAIESDMAPIFSIFVTLYALCTLYAYFGIKNIELINACQSYFVTSKLAFCAVATNIYTLLTHSQLSVSFALMTVLLCFDFIYGCSFYLSQ